MITRAIRALKLRLLDPYVHAAASILSIVIVAMVISSCEWCDDSNSSDASNIVTPITIGQPDATATVSTTPGHGSVPPSTTISHELRVTSAPAEGATVTFTPPPGSWAPGFVGIQPDNPNGPPPYVFTNVPVGVTITPNYRLDLPGSSNFLATYAQFSISTSVGNVTQFNCLVQVHRPDLQDCAAPAPVIGRSARVIGTPSEAPIPADKVDWSAWLSEFYLNSDSDMDTDRCQQIFDLLQDPSLFVALRFPTIPEIQSEENSWQAPVAFREGATPQISLLSYASGTKNVVSLPLETRFDRLDFAANVLPQEAGRQWVVLGGATDSSVVCPDGLAIDQGSWELYSEVYLDLGGDPSTCAGCVFEAWACFDGQDLPSALVKLAIDKAGFKSVIQEDGITCSGPFPIRLVDSSNPNPPVSVSGPNFAQVSAPAEVWFPHYISNLAGSPTQVSLAVQSELGLVWDVFGGDWQEPDLGDPIGSSISLGVDQTAFLWLRANVPDDLSGAETVLFEAWISSNPDQKAWNTDTLWIGEWTPPDEGGGIELPVDTTWIEEVDSTCP